MHRSYCSLALSHWSNDACVCIGHVPIQLYIVYGEVGIYNIAIYASMNVNAPNIMTTQTGVDKHGAITMVNDNMCKQIWHIITAHSM